VTLSLRPSDADHGQAFLRLDDLIDRFLEVIELRCETGLVEECEVLSGGLIHIAENMKRRV